MAREVVYFGNYFLAWNILIRKALNEYKLTTINLRHSFLALFNPNLGPDLWLPQPDTKTQSVIIKIGNLLIELS